jgi:hypothetical protein
VLWQLAAAPLLSTTWINGVNMYDEGYMHERKAMLDPVKRDAVSRHQDNFLIFQLMMCMSALF